MCQPAKTAGAWERPKALGEFVGRWPSYVRNFCANRFVPPESREDMEQELMLKLVASQAIEKYDPAKRGGADTAGLFFNYLTTVLRRAQQTIMDRKRRDAMRFLSATPSGMTWAEYAEANSERAATGGGAVLGAMASQLVSQIEGCAPGLAHTFRLLLSGYSVGDIARSTGLSAWTCERFIRSLPRILRGEYRKTKAYLHLEQMGEYPIPRLEN